MRARRPQCHRRGQLGDLRGQSGVAKTYGTFSIDAAGRLELHAQRRQCGGSGAQHRAALHELVTVATADGTTKVIDVTINGANDAAVITGTATSSVTEKSGVLNGTAGDATACGDLRCRPTWTARRPSWCRAACQDLRHVLDRRDRVPGATRSTTTMQRFRRSTHRDGTLHELVTVATADGTTKVIDITINGANDAAVITGTATRLGDWRKSGVLNGTAGDATASWRPRCDRRGQLGDLRGAERRGQDLRHVLDRAARVPGPTRSTTTTRRFRRSTHRARALHELVTVATADGTTQGDRHHHQRRQRCGSPGRGQRLGDGGRLEQRWRPPHAASSMPTDVDSSTNFIGNSAARPMARSRSTHRVLELHAQRRQRRGSGAQHIEHGAARAGHGGDGRRHHQRSTSPSTAPTTRPSTPAKCRLR